MKKIAANFEGFIEKIEDIERKALNSTPEIGEALLQQALKSNPNMTEAEWAETKSSFLTFLFCRMMTERPELMKELAGHVYNKMQEA